MSIRATHLVAALPAHIQTEAVEEVPRLLAIFGKELRKPGGESDLGDAL